MTLALLSLYSTVFLSSLTLTRLLCSDHARSYLLDRPNDRSLHDVPTPRTGGFAILVSLVVGLLLLWLLQRTVDPFSTCPSGSGVSHVGGMAWIIGMTLVLGAVSLWDDRAGLSPVTRLALHVLAACGLVWGTGWTVSTLSFPALGEASLGWFAAPFTVLAIVWMINLYNFMDGMDGFACGMSVVGFGGLGYVAWAGGQLPMALVSGVVAAACAGFLPFNFPPARIFMGDVGSIPLGFLAASLSLMGIAEGLFTIWVPVLLFSPFVVDATVTLFRRLARREKVWLPHREHYYQRLVLAGWGHKKTVLAEYALMLVWAMSAILYWKSGESEKLLVLVGCLVAYAALTLTVARYECHSVSPRRCNK